MSYVELHANSAFSFLRGASFPEQLAQVAAELEMPALGLLDRHGVYGSQRFSVAAREQKVRPIIGAELTMEDGTVLPVLVVSRLGYANLCSLLTQAHLRSNVKGECAVKWDEIPEFAQGLVALWGNNASNDLPGSARVSRAGFVVSPKRSFQSPRKRDAFASTRDACATRQIAQRVVPKERYQPLRKLRQLLPFHCAFPFHIAAQMRLREQRTKIRVTERTCRQHRQHAAVFHR